MLKLDVDLKPEERTATSDVVIKAGDLIELHKKSERLEVFTISGTLLGTVPETVAEKLSAEEWIGHIRSLKRSTIDNNIVFISVRFSSGERLRRERVVAQEETSNTPEDIKFISRGKLIELANNEGIKSYLRDERLQNAISIIDSAPNRQAALEAALTSDNFKEFADRLLSVIEPKQIDQ